MRKKPFRRFMDSMIWTIPLLFGIILLFVKESYPELLQDQKTIAYAFAFAVLGYLWMTTDAKCRASPDAMMEEKRLAQQKTVPMELRSKKPEGILFGKQNASYIRKPITEDGHVLVIGGSGSGKSSSSVIPTLLSNPHTAVFALDIKGELSMKNGVKSTSIRLNLLEKQKRESDQELSGLKGRMEYYEGEAGRIQKKMNGVQQRSLQLKEQLKSFNHILHPKMASNLRKEIEKAEKEQSDLEDYLIRVRENSGFQNDAEYHETENYVEDLNARLRSLSENMSTLKKEKKAMVAEYRKNYYMLPEELKQMVPVPENEERRKTENADEERHRGRI